MSDWALVTIGVIIGANISLVLYAIISSGGQHNAENKQRNEEDKS